jgi:hypothetical protein
MLIVYKGAGEHNVYGALWAPPGGVAADSDLVLPGLHLLRRRSAGLSAGGTNGQEVRQVSGYCRVTVT